MNALDIDALRSPSAYPHPAGHPTVLETHLSWVILAGEFAYKIKKAVHFDFIDTTSLAERHRLCEEELRLNRRLAPEIYVDVVVIARQGGLLRIGGSGEPVEYAVRMQRFDTSQELGALLEHGEVQPAEILSLAESLAAFHDGAAIAPAGTGAGHELQNAITRALASLQTQLQAPGSLSRLEEFGIWLRDQLQHRSQLLHEREAAGRVRECHGDLHARNIVRWRGALTPFDCLEFDPKLRWIDVLNDLAFLVMDLQSHARTDLAFLLLDRYLERSGDYGGLPALPLFAVYRALVRAMVDALAAGQQPQRHREYQSRLQARLRTAAAFTHPAPPALLLMHGPSGSGKSWLSGQWVGALPAIRIRSDVERKRLARAQLRHTGDDGAPSLYGDEFNQRTYARLLDCAQACLEGGFHAIVDAAFLRAEDRAPFRQLAAARGHRCLIISCQASPAVMAERVHERQRLHQDPSDADVAILQEQLRSLSPLLAEEASQVITADTRRTGVVAEVMDSIRRSLH